ncbi:MAG: hypothetical protein ABIH53_03735 [archaeon]
MTEKKIIARMILEVLGSPKEHVEETIKQVIKKLEEEKNIKLISQKTYETEQQEDSKLWSTFSEIEFQSENIKKLMDLCFDYMPSSVEIIEPAGMELDSSDVAELLNDLLAKLHRYDMVLKNLHAQNLVMKHDIELIKKVAKQAVEKRKQNEKKSA